MAPGGAAIDFMNWSFPLVRIFGIEIRMHWFMVLMIGILLLQAEAPGLKQAAPESVRSAFLDRDVVLTGYAGGLVRLSMPERAMAAKDVDQLRIALRACSG